MSPEKMNFDFGSQQMIIKNCKNLSIPISSQARKQPSFKRTVRFKISIVLSPDVSTNIPVNYHGKIPENRDFFFEPQFNLNPHLKNDGGVFPHIIDVFLNFVQTHNATAIPVIIPRRTNLKSIFEYNQEKYYFADLNTDPKLIFTGWKNKTVKIVKFAVTAMVFLTQLSIFPTTPTVTEI